MADPEIARRCRSCGASIRVRGFFCPQCGQSTAEPGADESDRSAETEEVFQATETASVDLSRMPTADLTHDSASWAETVPLQPITQEPDTDQDQRATTTRLTPPSAPSYSATRRLEESAHTQNVREALSGDAKTGLGKVREISNVMLEEASYDPSARFVLVAAVLFVLFLIILILSEMMR